MNEVEKIHSALVKHQISKASARGRKAVLVDALPTSEPILRHLGFEFLTRTQPFIYTPFPVKIH